MKDVTIGILGGGQLAKMTAMAANRFSIDVFFLDPDKKPPASVVAKHILGDFKNPKDVLNFSKKCDVITFDIESVNLASLVKVKKEIYPQPNIIELIQNKYKQRLFFKSKNIPVPFFKKINNINEALNYLPVVQKSIYGGYDGRGVVLIKKKSDFEKALKVESYIEEYIDIEKELSIIVARDKKGNIKVYEPVEMIFNKKANMLDFLLVPARIDCYLYKKAKDLAISAVKALNGIGIFAVEIFIDKKNKIFLNEIAPRPHNSGHYSIECCVTSQFEQLVRILCNMPLGATDLYSPCGTINIIGEEKYYGKPIYEGIFDVLKMKDVYVHIYGKKETFPFRKMGHVTVKAKTVKDVLKKIKFIKNKLKVKGEIYENRDNNGK